MNTDGTRRILAEAAALVERTDFTQRRCASDQGGQTVSPGSHQAAAYCVSGAARVVSGFTGVDGCGSSLERQYLAAMDAFCAHVGSETVEEWADEPGRTAADAVAALRGAADDQQEGLGEG